MKSVGMAGRRVRILLIFFAMVSGLLVYRLAEIQFFYPYKQEIVGIKKRQVNLFYRQPRRADILDRNGEPLAVSVETFSLYAGRANFLATNSERKRKLLFDFLLERSKLRSPVPDATEQSERKTLLLAERLTPNEAKYIRSLRLQGIWLDAHYTRYYPASEVAASLVGFVDKDNRGIEGLELLYDKRLNGKKREERLLRDARGQVIKVLAADNKPEERSALQLSLDLQLQYMAYHHLVQGIRSSDAVSGNLMTLDVHTGEVYAMAQYPSFNPNNRKRLDVNAVRNRALTDVFEPGSTIKPIILSAILEQKNLPADYKVDTAPGYIRRGDLLIRDARNLQKLNLNEVIAKSSNVAMVKISEQTEPRRLLRTLNRIGLGRRTGSMFPGEREGYLPLRPLKSTGRATLAYGYGLSVTAVQLAKAYGVLANGGDDFYVNFAKTQTEDKMPVLEERIAIRVMEALKGVVSPGATGAAAGVDGYEIAGKTGTVHKSNSAGGYDKSRYLAIFVGIAPIDNPRFVTLVLLDEPGTNKYYGGEAAAPVFSAYMRDLFRIYGITPQQGNT